MKIFLSLLAVLLSPLWLPFWALRRFGRVLGALLLAGVISGCANSSHRFETSPCACDFQPVNVQDVRSAANA